MARKNKRNAFPKALKEIQAVDVDDFIFAYSLGAAAASYRMPMESPAESGFTLTNGKETREFRLTDIPLNRAVLAIRDHCEGDTVRFMAIMQRIFAFTKLQDDERLSRWTRKSDKDPDRMEIHGAVLEVAATLPLERNGRFDEDAFFKAVESITGLHK